MKKFSQKVAMIAFAILFCSFQTTAVVLASDDVNTVAIGPIGEIGPSSTAEADTTMSNAMTGSYSDNSNENIEAISSTVQTENNAFVENNATLRLDSGQNQIEQNSGAESLKSGDIKASVNLVNLSGAQYKEGSSAGAITLDGSNLTSFVLPNEPIPYRVLFPGSKLQNSLTGFNTNNTNFLDQSALITFLTDSQNLTSNTIEIEANSGLNRISENTQVGNITTGNIDLGVNLINLNDFQDPAAILYYDLFSIKNGLTGDIYLPQNDSTGSGSQNLNAATNTTSIEVSKQAENNVQNTFDIDSNTGKNLLSANTGIGNVTTGENTSGGSVLNLVNDSPIFYIINVFGKWLGNALGLDGQKFIVNEIDNGVVESTGNLGIDQPSIGASTTLANQATGVNSANQNIADSKLLVNAKSNAKNGINNKIHLKANTGENQIAENTLIGNIATGSVRALANVINIASSIPSGFRNLQIKVVNIFGDWRGNLRSQRPVPVEPSKEESMATVDRPIVRNNYVPATLTSRPIRERGANLPTNNTGKEPLHQDVSFDSPALLAAQSPTPEAGSPLSFLIIPGLALGGWLIAELLMYLARRKKL